MPRPKLTEKPCRTCGIIYPREHYYFRNKEKDQRWQHCRKCAVAVQGEWLKKNKDKVNARRRERYTPERGRRQNLVRYGMTTDDYESMLKTQNGVCAVCGERRLWRGRDVLHIDHCHKTGRVRGLLCQQCNLALGALGDSPERIKALADYATLYEETLS